MRFVDAGRRSERWQGAWVDRVAMGPGRLFRRAEANSLGSPAWSGTLQASFRPWQKGEGGAYRPAMSPGCCHKRIEAEGLDPRSPWSGTLQGEAEYGREVG